MLREEKWVEKAKKYSDQLSDPNHLKVGRNTQQTLKKRARWERERKRERKKYSRPFSRAAGKLKCKIYSKK